MSEKLNIAEIEARLRQTCAAGARIEGLKVWLENGGEKVWGHEASDREELTLLAFIIRAARGSISFWNVEAGKSIDFPFEELMDTKLAARLLEEGSPRLQREYYGAVADHFAPIAEEHARKHAHADRRVAAARAELAKLAPPPEKSTPKYRRYSRPGWWVKALDLVRV